MFDAAVNSGVRASAICLQRVLDCKPDGVLGPVTLGLVARAKLEDVLDQLLQLRWSGMQHMAGWGRYAGGWGSRLLKVQAAALKMIYAA